MRKLKKKFTSVRKTVEAMDSSCLNGCSCSVVTCTCSTVTTNYDTYSTQQNYLKNTYRDAAY